jgi:glyoxylase-like metal-dependent hydrolase (beta-lactamase superfamily II)
VTQPETALPDGLYHLPLDVVFDGRDVTIHPVGIETARGLLLVDTGFPGTLDALEDRLGAAGFELADVATVLVTHQDGDHAGNLAAVLDGGDPFVIAHEAAASIVDGREPTRGSGDDRYPPARVDLELGGAATLATRAGPARIVPTPGHTPGHVSVYLPEHRILLAVDALTADEDGLGGPRPDVTVDLDEALASVERLAALDVERTLCYHGGLVAAGSERLAEIAERA